MTEHVVMFSGGVGSWCAAKRVAESYGTENLTLLFADTLMEDPDLYRFLEEGAAVIGGRLVKIAEGRTPWQVFNGERFLGNSRVDPCSRVLKRELMDRWMAEHYQPETTVCYVGIDWSEEHRYQRIRDRRLPWRYEAPMCEPPYLTKQMMFAQLAELGIQPPRLYSLGFAHNNCGGFCIKAGLGHFAMLLREMPERYAYHEAQENAIRETLGDVSILRDRRNGHSEPLTLLALRERLQSGGQVDMFDIGGCGCMEEVSR